jgi:hypothetical protein
MTSAIPAIDVVFSGFLPATLVAEVKRHIEWHTGTWTIGTGD